MNFYSFHIGDYAADTAHLEPMEDIAYRRMLDLYYRTEKPLPQSVEDIARLIRLREHQAAIRDVINEFFTASDDGWRHGRCDAEIERAQDKRMKAAESARKGWQSGRTAKAMRTQSERIANTSQESCEGSTPNPNPNPIPNKLNTAGAVQDEKPLAEPPHAAAQPTPPPDFDGTNAEVLNGKAVVALAPCWELPDGWGVDAESLGWKPAEVLKEAERFRQYWVAGRGAGKRRSVKGWRQSWSNWLGKAERDKR